MGKQKAPAELSGGALRLLREVGFILRPFVGDDKALAIAFLWLCVLLSVALFGGIIYIFMNHYKFQEVSYDR